MSTRFAIYYAPAPSTELWRLGSHTLGYDGVTGSDIDPGVGPTFPAEEWRRWTEAPRRYGFHATLKAPFELKAGFGLADVMTCAESLAARIGPVPLPGLTAQVLGGFVALMPQGAPPGLSDLAAACVEGFEPLRAELSQADRGRRGPLSARQAAYLERFGYPHVLDEFRFHMTLTDRLDADQRGPVLAFLAERFRGAVAGAVVDALTIVRQDGRGERFRVVGRVPLRGG